MILYLGVKNSPTGLRKKQKVMAVIQESGDEGLEDAESNGGQDPCARKSMSVDLRFFTWVGPFQDPEGA